MSTSNDVTIPNAELAAKIANTIRFLSADGIQAANSGHPGLPMGCADIATVLWTRFLRIDPTDPAWFNRDRFVLSAGHGSMLLYSMLHFTGLLSLDDLRQFRQFGSKTPGHPEYGDVPGVDVTGGPLGAGFATAVGLAMAEAMLADRFNTDAAKIVDHYTYVLMGDGCNMEGVTNEAASLAGHLKLGKLIAMYDDNEITIEGSTDLAFSENVNARYEALGWHVQDIDGHDHEAIAAAITAAQQATDRPSVIVAHTTIGKGAPTKAGSHKVHGEPLGAEEISAGKAAIGFPDESFYVPAEVAEYFAGRRDQWRAERQAWADGFEAYKAACPAKAADLARIAAGDLPDGWTDAQPEFGADTSMATRVSGGKALNAFAAAIDELVGGSADLEPSNKTGITQGNFAEWMAPGDYAGRNIHFGVREHAMGQAANGLALHGLIPFCATFMVFHDYMRPAVRMAALMRLSTVFVYTHDSIFVGEDGPTHQPVEQHASIRAIPRVVLMRPCDANETAYAWRYAIGRSDGPTCMALTRQNLQTLDRTKYGAAEGVLKGGYVLEDEDGADLLMVASGSEVHLALDAAAALRAEGRKIRIVSMPSPKLFAGQSAEYRESVLPKAITKRIVLEAGIVQGWEGILGADGVFIGLDDFGVSGPMSVLAEELGLNVDSVVGRVKAAGL